MKLGDASLKSNESSVMIVGRLAEWKLLIGAIGA
jgi:hypothetical protein